VFVKEAVPGCRRRGQTKAGGGASQESGHSRCQAERSSNEKVLSLKGTAEDWITTRDEDPEHSV
jgi:hypothetical protein